MRVLIRVKVNSHLVMAATALLFAGLFFPASPEISGVTAERSLLSAIALSTALAIGRHPRRPRT